MSVGVTPCERVPELFRLVQPDGRRTGKLEKQCALWLCRKQCPLLEACRRRPLEPGHVQGGRIVQADGTVTEEATTGRQDQAARICRICCKRLGAGRRTYCSDTCARKRHRIRPQYLSATEVLEETELALAGQLLWRDLHPATRDLVVTRLHADGVNDVQIAARFPGITTRVIRQIRTEHLKLPGHKTGRPPELLTVR